MKKPFVIILLVIVCLSCNVTHNWNGSSVGKKSHATFSDFSGTQKFKLKLDHDTGSTTVNYSVQVTSGDIRMIIKYKNSEIESIRTSDKREGSIKIQNSSDPNVELILKGTNARGSYQVELVD